MNSWKLFKRLVLCFSVFCFLSLSLSLSLSLVFWKYFIWLLTLLLSHVLITLKKVWCFLHIGISISQNSFNHFFAFSLFLLFPPKTLERSQLDHSMMCVFVSFDHLTWIGFFSPTKKTHSNHHTRLLFSCKKSKWEGEEGVEENL